MKEECLICKAPLEYLTQDELMECAICHKQERSKTRCVEGHYVCSECHTQGMEKSLPVCSRSGQNNQCIGKRCPFVGGRK